MNIPVDSASPVSFLKQNLLHELKLRDPQLKIRPMDMKIRALYCCLNNDTIKKNQKKFTQNTVQWMESRINHVFFSTGHERNILGNDNLLQIGNRNRAEPTATSS